MSQGKGRTDFDKARRRIHRLTLTGLLFALAVVLSLVENSLPPLPVPAPVKPGLANVVVMYALFYIGYKEAFSLVILKAALALITRGLLAGGLSTAGGLLSYFVMLGLALFFREKITWLMLSICGAVSHNIGQLLVLTLLIPLRSVLTLLPFLTVGALVTGSLSVLILQGAAPALQKAVKFSDQGRGASP
jgi:heptaprenyl diphosphate synthase